jgi:hypothetical protein
MAYSASAVVSYDEMITAIFGGGNPDTGWTADTANNIQLALRAKNRSTGDTPNIAGVYSFATAPPTRGLWNYEFSINSDGSAGTDPLTTYDFYLSADRDPSACVEYGIVEPLFHWGDNSYGNNFTANGAGVEPADAIEYQTFPSLYNVAQNSQNITFGDYPGTGGGLALDENATYNYELFAVAKGAGPDAARLASVGITVVVGAGGPDSCAPIISNISPTLVPVNTSFSLTANVDDTTTGGSDIDSAAYSIDGAPTAPMDAADGTFDEPNEDVVANPSGIADAGVHNVCVSAVDSAGNASDPECTLLVTYDPSAGFVTGGGWINSSSGAAVGVGFFATKWDQDFSLDTAGWFDNDVSGFEGYGLITALGDGTAKVEGWLDPDGKYYGPFSRFDGYHSAWPGTWIAEIDIYLDPAALSDGEGFDYSVAATGSDGAHQRDYIFHVTKDTSTGALLVAGSNNTNFAPREDLENINHYEVTTAGWYTLQHRFYDAGGYLAVDLNLLDDLGNVLFTETRSNLSDTIPGEVGGNRYAWFTHVTVDGGIVVDNHQRFEKPTGKANFGFVSKYKKGASVPDGSTEFVFNAGGLNFHSSSYQWLVVNGNGQNAQFKGTGTINGAGNYGFMIWAWDGSKNATPDTFRISIWDADDGDAVVYDNGVNQELGGGNIMVHTSKK